MRLHSADSPCRSVGAQRGTTLIEILVVIVIFLVGILAVVQIFPRGFQILMTTRNNSVSGALAREAVEQLKASPDQLPEMILPAYYSGGSYIVDPNYNPGSTDSTGNSLLPNGNLLRDGNTLGPWPLYSGPNVVKRIVGEGRRVPAPRAVGATGGFYGGLLLLQFGPIDYRPTQGNISVYANDLVPLYREVDPKDRFSEGEYYVVSPDDNQITLRLPSGPTNRQYRVAFSAYVLQGADYVKRDFIDVQRVDVPADYVDPGSGLPVFSVTLQSLIPAVTLGSVDPNTLAVQRAYYQVAKNATFSGVDAFEYKLLDTNIGVLLFNPLANSTYLYKPSGREPLMARVNYDVYDWRVLKDDFRLGRSTGAQQFKLSVGNLKVAGMVGLDGRNETNISILESAPADPAYSNTSAADEAKANNFVLIDKDTGGVVMERLPSDPLPPTPSGNALVVVNKSSGVVTFRDTDGNPANGTNGKVLLPDGTVMDVVLENRALRALYRVRNEFSVQVQKPASHFEGSNSLAMGVAQYYVGGLRSDQTVLGRIYFAPANTGMNVSFGEVNVFMRKRNTSNQPVLRQFSGVSGRVQSALPGQIGPYVDLAAMVEDANWEVVGYPANTDVDPRAAIRDVAGASIRVRVLWNPDTFTMSSDPQVNLTRLNTWGQGYRRNTNETFLERTEIAR
jgi:type II secretory pathway pseudopilin PulG